MAALGLHLHGERKGWHWTTDEITDGLAARTADLARLGEESFTAYVLAHAVETDGPSSAARPQAVIVGGLTRDAGGAVRWTGPDVPGATGAPVFYSLPKDDGGRKLLCAGVLLPRDADDPHPPTGPDVPPAPGHPNRAFPVAPFDAIRTAVHALADPAADPPATPAAADPRRPASRAGRLWRRATGREPRNGR